MNILLSKIKAHEIARERYKDRIVTVWNNQKQAWFMDSVYTLDQAKATQYTLARIIERLEYCDLEHIEVHFVSPFDTAEIASIKEFDDEGIFNCTSIKWDK